MYAVWAEESLTHGISSITESMQIDKAKQQLPVSMHTDRNSNSMNLSNGYALLLKVKRIKGIF